MKLSSSSITIGLTFLITVYMFEISNGKPMNDENKLSDWQEFEQKVHREITEMLKEFAQKMKENSSVSSIELNQPTVNLEDLKSLVEQLDEAINQGRDTDDVNNLRYQNFDQEYLVKALIDAFSAYQSGIVPNPTDPEVIQTVTKGFANWLVGLEEYLRRNPDKWTFGTLNRNASIPDETRRLVNDWFSDWTSSLRAMFGRSYTTTAKPIKVKISSESSSESENSVAEDNMIS